MLPYDKINNKMKSQPTKWEKNESHIFIWGHTIKIHFKNLKKNAMRNQTIQCTDG